MTDWYYATTDGQRHGPLPAAGLAALAREGAIGPQTPVWRDGLAGWMPLSALAAELGLAPPSLGPPPVPGTPPLPPGSAAPIAAPVAPPRRSGCVLAAIVCAGGLFLVMVVGILAAIALPSYQQYTTRSRAAAAIAEARAHQPAVTTFLEREGRCPGNDDAGFAAADSYAGGALKSIRFGQFDESELCGLEAMIHAPGNEALDGQAVWLEYNPAVDTWLCSSAVEDRHLPHECRG